jgi:hypothetical protein
MAEKQPEHDRHDEIARQQFYGKQVELDLGLILDDDYGRSFAAEERRETKELSTPQPELDRWTPLNRNTLTELFGGHSAHVGAPNDTDTGISIAQALKDGKKLTETMITGPVVDDLPPVAPPLPPKSED